MKIGEYETHPAADIFPLLEGEDFDRLVADIREHGQLEPCWRMWLESDGPTRTPVILDGRNRVRACLLAGRTPLWRDYDGDSPTAFVVSLNLKRRHLTKSQAAVCAEEALPLYEADAKARQRASGGDVRGRTVSQKIDGPNDGKAAAQAAADFGTNRTYVAAAKRLRVEAPELHAAVKAGMMDISEANKAARLEPGQRAEVLRKVESGEAKDAKAAVRQVQRDTAVAVIESEPQPLPAGPFRVIAADPPWAYEKRKDDGSHRSALTYPTMTTEEICAMPVGERAHQDSVLWLWTTNAFMRDAFGVVEAWGFEPKTILTWVKDRMGTGDWLRGKTEHCIMAVRGRPTVVLTNQTTVLEGPVREHSRKPDQFYSLVEALCPGSKLEVFARESRDGWMTWGAESERFDARQI